MIENLINSGVPPELIVVTVSALPILELRGALPVAINIFHLPWYQALSLAIIGNLLPVPLLLLFFKSLTAVARRSYTGKKLTDWLFRHTRKNIVVIEKYERTGLMLFVAIPLPGTGAWTGSVAAFLTGMKFNRALISITCGVIIAGVIVTCLSLLGWVGAVIAGLGLASLAAVGIWNI